MIKTIREAVAPFIDAYSERYKSDPSVFAKHSDNPVKYLFKFNHEDGFGDKEIIQEFCHGTGLAEGVVERWRSSIYGDDVVPSTVNGWVELPDREDSSEDNSGWDDASVNWEEEDETCSICHEDFCECPDPHMVQYGLEKIYRIEIALAYCDDLKIRELLEQALPLLYEAQELNDKRVEKMGKN